MTEYTNITFATGKGKRRGTLTISADSAETAGFDFKNINTAGQQKIIHIAGDDITDGIWLQNYDSYILKLNVKNTAWVRFTGLKYDAYDIIDTLFKTIGKQLRTQYISTKGSNIGEFNVDEHNMSFLIDSKLSFEVGLNHIVQTVVQGKNELAFEFNQDDTIQGEQLYEMRVWVPDQILLDENGDVADAEGDEEEDTPALKFQRELLSKGDMQETQLQPIATFELMLAVPRGKYTIELYADQMKLHNKTFNYKIQYKGITKMFLFDNVQQSQHLFVIGLNPPIRQGRTSYPYLVIQFNSNEQTTVELNWTEEEFQAKSKLVKPTMSDATWDVVSRVFKAVSNGTVVVPGKFRSKHGSSAVRCNLKAQDGYLFLLEKSLFYVKKPPTFIRHAAIQSIEFDRVSTASSTNKTIDMKVIVNEGGKLVEYAFSSINREEFEGLERYVKEKNIHYEVIEDSTGANMRMSGIDVDDANYKAALEDGRMDDDDDEEGDSDFGGSESESGSGSASGSGSSDASDSDESMAPEVDDDDTGKTSKKSKKSSDSPSRKKGSRKVEGVKGASSAYIFYVNELRQKLKDEGTDIKPTEVAKLAGEKWKALTDEEKQPYQKMADEDRTRYEAELAAAPRDSNGQTTKANTKKRTKEQKAPTAYQLYVKDHSATVRSENPDMGFGDVSKRVAEMWKEVSEHEKDRYKQKSAELQAEIDSGDRRESTKERPKKKTKRRDSESDDDENIEVEVAAAPRAITLKEEDSQ